MSAPNIGFGNSKPKWVLHIANRPDLEVFEHDIFRQLELGEAADVISQTSNHWRKVFSIMAKISFALFDTGCASWQQYRDSKLLTSQGFEAISSEPYTTTSTDQLAIICGFTYAGSQVELNQLLSHIEQPKLLLSETKDFLVTPYFDWRQLNNEMLAHLIEVMRHFLVR